MKKYILLLAAAGLMSSCYDLDQFPHDKTSSGTFWQTEEHAYQGMVAMYETLRNENTFGAYYNFGCTGRNCHGLQQLADACHYQRNS